MCEEYDTGLVAQLIHDTVANEIDVREHITHPEEAGDESYSMEYYPDEEGDPEEVYLITVKKGSVYIGS